MVEGVHSARFISFGIFEVDLQNGELRKAGLKLKLTGQPFQVLAILLEHPGEVVTRTELQKRLWPDTFVDIDHNLNTAINKIREVLGDSAENPQFVETLPRRGYRFIGAPRTTATPVQKRDRRTLNLILVAGTLMGILASVIVFLIAFNTGRLRDRVFGRAAPPSIRSLAVLPVKNFSGDPGQDFLADGMTDELIAGLAQIKAVKVISRTSVMHYKSTTETLPQIASELGVDGIVEASVTRSGDRVRITARLIEARQDRHLWASNYEREMTDVLALQSEVVQAIANEIRVQVTPQESEQLKIARRIDPDVYDATLKGKATLEQATSEEDFHQAIGLFQKAIDRDPTYAPAWAGLGDATWGLAATGFEFVNPAEVRDKAIAAAE